MRIACLQFAPQVGDINNNLNRADSVLSKADPDDLESLDILVLPELAFSGTNFKSLHQISPYLEPSTSGISSLWARTAALKYDTTVVVGYPEKVDVSARWPTSPEYYNSAIVVNRDGETVANYRKSFLWATDEKWALEGTDGFFYSDMQDLGQTAMGIGMDLKFVYPPLIEKRTLTYYSPYRFEAAWHAFEFAYHVVDTQANLVIVTMSWSTREESRMFSRLPAEPDMDTLTYWAQRLEPVIRAESKDEIIVVFCNRCGKEDKVVYAGTSAVIGVKDGEVSVYGLLGRGVKDLLVVDTSVAPFAKLVYRPESDVNDKSLHVPKGRTIKNVTTGLATSQQVGSAGADTSTNGVRKATPTPGSKAQPKRLNPPSPIIIPNASQQYLPLATPIDESPVLATPTAPSPTPYSERPQIDHHEKGDEDYRAAGTYSRADTTSEYLDFYGDNIWVNQSAPRHHATSPSSGQVSEKYFWLPPQPTFKSPRDANFPELPPVSPIAAVSLLKMAGNNQTSMKHLPAPELALSPELDGGHPVPNLVSFSTLHGAPDGKCIITERAVESPAPPRPASPKSRNASRTGRPIERRPSDIEQPDLSGMIERLESLARRPGSAMDSNDDDSHDYRQGRPRTPKSRPASHARRPSGTPQPRENALVKASHGGASTHSSPSIFSEATIQGHRDLQSMTPRSYDRRAREPGTIRPCPRAGARSRNRSITGFDVGQTARSRSGSATSRVADKASHIEPDETRTLVWSELSKLVGEVLQRPKSRNVSRGRQPATDRSMSVGVPMAVRTARSENRGIHSAPRIDQRVASQDRHAIIGNRRGRSSTSHNTATVPMEGSTSPHDPEDEIVAEIIFHHHGCPTHSHRPQSTPSGAGTPNQMGNPTSPPSMPRNTSCSNQGQDSRASQRSQAAPRKSSSPPKSNLGRRRSQQSGFGFVNSPKAPTPLTLSARQNPSESCPPLDGTSIHTIATQNGSPATPPPRVFEPPTPKAMKFEHVDFGAAVALTPGSDPTGSGDFALLKSLGTDLLGIAPDRPRSVVW